MKALLAAVALFAGVVAVGAQAAEDVAGKPTKEEAKKIADAFIKDKFPKLTGYGRFAERMRGKGAWMVTYVKWEDGMCLPDEMSGVKVKDANRECEYIPPYVPRRARQ